MVTIDELRLVLSKERLVPYENDTKNSEHVIEKYNHNILICEALYPALHYLEVLLRNHISYTIGSLFGDKWLINIPETLQLSFKDKEKINLIKNQVFREKKREPSQADIVSRLSFGFWCALFHKKFDPVIWHRKNAIKSVFPYLTRQNQTRKFVEKKILRIKSIRNRIAHHERIWGGSRDVYETYLAYMNCVELIYAMSEVSVELLKMTDKFPEVYKKVSGEVNDK